MARRKVETEYDGVITYNMLSVWWDASWDNFELRKRISTLMFATEVKSPSEGLVVFGAPALTVTKQIADEIMK